MVAWLPAVASAAASVIGSHLTNRSNERSSSKALDQEKKLFNKSLKQQNKEYWRSQKFTEADAKKTRQFTARQQSRAEDFTADQAQRARRFTKKQANLDRDLQKTFAKKSTGWAFDDLMSAADEAGIHRLAALGSASQTPYQPIGASSGAGSSSGGMGSPSSGISAGGIPSAPDIEPALGGSIIGDGMNAISDLIVDEANRREQAKADQEARASAARAEARDTELLRAQTGVMDAEAEMYRAQARTAISVSSRPGLGTPQSPNMADPQQVFQPFQVNGEKPRNYPVGPDLDEMITGAGIIAGNWLRNGGIQKTFKLPKTSYESGSRRW